MYYDAHTHLNSQQLYKRRERYYTEFIEIGGEGIVVVGINPVSNNQAIIIAEKTHNKLLPVKITLGIHPYEIGHGSVQSKDDVDQQIKIIEQQLNAFPQYVVAIGETGIDAHYPNYQKNKKLQQYSFDKQCQLAQKYDLPIVIHSRDHFDDTLHIIKAYKNCKIYFHCRGYGPNQVRKLSRLFPHIWIGFCGNLTYPQTTQLQESLKVAWKYQEQTVKLAENQTNNNSLYVLFETDAPYLTPLKYQGKINHPARIDAIYESASRLLNQPITTIQKTVKQNFLSIYKHIE